MAERERRGTPAASKIHWPRLATNRRQSVAMDKDRSFRQRLESVGRKRGASNLLGQVVEEQTLRLV